METTDLSDYEKIFKGCTPNDAGQLDLISDADLTIAVMLQLVGNYTEKTSNLPLPCQNVLAIFLVLDRAYMEDFEQVYTDPDITPIVPSAIAGLFEMNENELAEIIKQSHTIYEKSKDIIEQYKNSDIKWEKLLDLGLWNGVSESFHTAYNKSDYLKPSIAKYIRNNYRNFLSL